MSVFYYHKNKQLCSAPYISHELNSLANSEKAIKEWKRRWKLDLIEQQNPEWRDLYKDVV